MQISHDSVESLSATQAAVAIVDKHGIVSFSSPAMESLFKCSPEQIEGHEVAEFLPGLPLKKRTPGVNLTTAESWAQEHTWRRFKGISPNGDRVLLDVSMQKLRMSNDQFILLGMRPAKHDGESEDDMSRLIEDAKASTDAVMITDTSGVVRFVNSAFEHTSGYSLSAAIGNPASFIKPDFNYPDSGNAMWEALLAGNDYRAIFTSRNKSGEIFHEDTRICPVIDGFGSTTHFVVTSTLLDEPLQSLLLRLQHEAYHDAMTGLANRGLFLDRLGQLIYRASRRHEKFALIFVDLDNLKTINDSYGHLAGDTMLRATAISLKGSIRAEDTVARIGGDEFAATLLDVHQRQEIELVTNKILRSLELGVNFESRNIPIHASIGASIFPHDGESSEILMKQADFAMYMAKSAGGHCLRLFNKSEEFERPVALEKSRQDEKR